MNHLHEVSGRGLAVTDHYDAMQLAAIGNRDPLRVLVFIMGSAKFNRAFIREIEATSESMTKIVRIAYYGY